MHLTLLFFAQILHSTSYFFIIVFPSAFYDRSRMTGRYLILLCKNRFFSFTHSYFHSSVSAHACPFRRLRRHLPRSRGRLTFRIFYFPSFGDGLKTCMLSFCSNCHLIRLGSFLLFRMSSLSFFGQIKMTRTCESLHKGYSLG